MISKILIKQLQIKQTITQEILRFRQLMKGNFSVEDIFEIFLAKTQRRITFTN